MPDDVAPEPRAPRSDAIMRRRRRVAAVGTVVLAIVVGAAAGRLGRHGPRQPLRRDVTVYAGLGAWVDTYDYVPTYAGNALTVTPGTVDYLASRGVRTIYLQAARNDTKTPGGLIATDLLTPILQRAHAKGIAVVGWSTPRFTEVAFDLERLVKIADFVNKGQRFDGIAVDIEDNETNPDALTRSEHLLELSRQLRAHVGPDVALGAIVMPAVQLDVVNPAFWPAFPWRALRDSYDVWMPMTYWSTRDAGTEWRDAERYTTESVRLMREHLDDPAARVHPIGGIADKTSAADVAGFVRALGTTASIGGSLYDAATTSPDLWPSIEPLPAALTPLPSSEPSTPTTTR